jgi:hypothetical protein
MPAVDQFGIRFVCRRRRPAFPYMTVYCSTARGNTFYSWVVTLRSGGAVMVRVLPFSS